MVSFVLENNGNKFSEYYLSVCEAHLKYDAFFVCSKERESEYEGEQPTRQVYRYEKLF